MLQGSSDASVGAFLPGWAGLYSAIRASLAGKRSDDCHPPSPLAGPTSQLEQHGVVTKRDPELADDMGHVDAELVRQPQHLALAEVDEHG